MRAGHALVPALRPMSEAVCHRLTERTMGRRPTAAQGTLGQGAREGGTVRGGAPLLYQIFPVWSRTPRPAIKFWSLLFQVNLPIFHSTSINKRKTIPVKLKLYGTYSFNFMYVGTYYLHTLSLKMFPAKRLIFSSFLPLLTSVGPTVDLRSKSSNNI